MEQYLAYTATESIRRQLDFLEQQNRMQERRHQEAQTYLRDQANQLPLIEPDDEPAQRGGRRAYPAAGRREFDQYQPLRTAAISATVALTVLIGLVSFAISRHESNSPANTDNLNPTPSPLVDRARIRSIEAYTALIQAKKNPDGALYQSFDIDSEALPANVRVSPSLYAHVVGQIPDGTHVSAPNVFQQGDNPFTEPEERYDSPWTAARCSDLRKLMINQVPIEPNKPPEADMCFIFGGLTKPHREP